MKIVPIRTREDHRAALDRIDDLWGSEVGTPDGDLLDILVDLVELYETRLLGPVRVRPSSSERAAGILGQQQAMLAALRESRPNSLRKREVNVIRAMRRHPELWSDSTSKPVSKQEPQAAA